MGAPVDEGNERFRDLVNRSPDGILIVQDLKIAFLNPAAVTLLGVVRADQALGQSPFVFFPPDRHMAIGERFDRVLRGEHVPPGDETLVRLDGTTTDVDVSSVRFEHHGRLAIELIVRGISARKRVEATLREREERLTLAFAGAREGVWDWDLTTGAVIYSPRWKQMLGYADDEIEPNVHAWEALLHPDDKSRADALHEAVLRGQRSYEEEFRLRHKDGHYITVLTRGLAIRRDKDGEVVRIVGTHLDITERKRTESALRESEERLTLAFAGAQEGVWDWNLETDAVVYSSRWKEMLGYADHEIEPHISAWERLVHPDDRALADRANASVSSGQPAYEAEFRLRHKDGHYVHVLSRGFPVRRESGGPVVRIVGTHFDLTERKKREAEQARTELLTRLVFAQEDERRRIARDMHDEFGEQLTALALRIGMLKTACAGRPDLEAQIDALDTIARRLDQEVDQLVWDLRPTALDDLGLRAALTNYVQDWSDRVSIPATFHTSGLLDERLPPEVETTLYRIAQEALNNSAKYSRARHVGVMLERRADCVLLVVEDDGIGFDASDEGRRSGGFGLRGMQERAGLIGASLEIESAPGHGTTVLLRLDTPTRAKQPMVDHV